MTKNKVQVIALLMIGIFIIFLVSSSFIRTSFTSKNFPLVKKWSVQLTENIQQISTSANQIILIRTASGINALDLNSGKILWHRETGWLATNKSAKAQNNLVFLAEKKGVLALHQADGKIVWQKKLISPESAEVVDATMDFVVVFDTQQLFVYKSSDGTLILQKPVCRNSNLAHLTDTRLYFPCFGMTAVDISSGKTVWETKHDRAVTAAAYAGNIMYSSPSDDIFTAYDLENRLQIWRKQLQSDRVQELVVSGKFLFMTDGKQLCVLGRTDGDTKWCDHGIIKPQNPVKIADIVFIFNGPQNVITAFDINNGTQLGQLKITNFNLFTIYRQLMVSTDDLLIFGSGNEVFAFGK